MRRALALSLLAAGALACSEPRSFLVVVIDAEPALVGAIDAIEVAITGPTEARPLERIELRAERLPLTIGLEAEGGLEPVSIEARALAGDEVRVLRRVRTGFVRGEVRTVHVRLELACDGELCGDTTTCVQGACVSDRVPPASLPPWTGNPSFDAGVPIAVDGGADGGIAVDAGPDAGPPPLDPLPGPIAAGHDHTCALRGETLWCWGASDEGQAGGASGPTPVAFDLTRVAGACAGMRFTCAWTLDGEAWCAGRMSDEDAPPVFDAASKRPLSLPVGTRARMLACGYDHVCALLDDGRVACAGVGGAGQLGDGSASDAVIDAPVIAALDTGAARIAAGEDVTCAHLVDGRVACWGDNTLLRAGAPMAEATVATPRVVDSMPIELAATTALAAGGGHACAVAGGRLYCWGANTHGERGCLGTSPRAVATPVPDASAGVGEIALGLDHTCAVIDGIVRCVGAGATTFGQTGRDPAGGVEDCAMVPVAGIAAETATHVAAGRFHACALLASGEVACWGLNERGQLGGGGESGWMVRRVTLP